MYTSGKLQYFYLNTEVESFDIESRENIYDLPQESVFAISSTIDVSSFPFSVFCWFTWNPSDIHGRSAEQSIF